MIPSRILYVIASILVRRGQSLVSIDPQGLSSSSLKLTVSETNTNSPIAENSHLSWIIDDCSNLNPQFHIQTWEDAVSDCYAFLFKNIMPCDMINAASLGFQSDFEHPIIESTRGYTKLKRQMHLPDGLSTGIVKSTIYMALESTIRYPWMQTIPKSIFMEYVLPFAVVNEARTHWRPIIHDAIQPTLQRLLDTSNSTIEDVVREVNKDLWTALGKLTVSYNDRGEEYIQTDPIVFKAGQTPLVYDPMSIMQFGYGSCTGLSILLIDALRCAGIPARLCGTPAWNGYVERGNHNWIEVYSVAKKNWLFLEPAYGDYGSENADNMNKNPCERWFCNKEMFEGTKVFATRYDREKSGGVFYPMAWDIDNMSVPGVDRTQCYIDICSKC